MGVSFNGHAGAIDWIQSRFKKNRPATLYYDEVRTPTYVECSNEVVEEACSADFTGVFHAG
jgi:dTDP-4-dehydrorhamnose reductase